MAFVVSFVGTDQVPVNLPLADVVQEGHLVDSSVMVPWDACSVGMLTGLVVAEIQFHPDSLLFDALQVDNKPPEMFGPGIDAVYSFRIDVLVVKVF